MSNHIESLGKFALALVEHGTFRDVHSARDTLRGWIGHSDYQAFQGPSKLRLLTQTKATVILDGLLKKLGDPLNFPLPTWENEDDREAKQAWLPVSRR